MLSRWPETKCGLVSSVTNKKAAGADPAARLLAREITLKLFRDA